MRAGAVTVPRDPTWVCHALDLRQEFQAISPLQ